MQFWCVRLGVVVITCFGVFVLPFLVPPKPLMGLSAANLAGFNNSVAAIMAAVLGVAVFLVAWRWPRVLHRTTGDVPMDRAIETSWYDHMPQMLVWGVIAGWGVAVFLFGLEIIRLGVRYEYDWGYFLDRISAHAEFGRKLYSQMEFAYGPVLLDLPLITKAIFRHMHLSLAGAYLLTLTLETMVGLGLIAYVVDRLPTSRWWKITIFLLTAAGMMVGNMGPNYTFVRFAPQLALLVLIGRTEKVWIAAAWTFLGEILCLGLSPEIGFAFLVSSIALCVYFAVQRDRSWAVAASAAPLSAGLFLLFEGQPYLQRIFISAHGIYSFPLEPIPFILVFLVALVWLVPNMLAALFREEHRDAPMLAALYLASLALLPAAFGRADPGHVYWNGISVFLLSAVAISRSARPKQLLWGACLAFVFLWMVRINWNENRFEMRPVLQAELHDWRDRLSGHAQGHMPAASDGFSMQALQSIVGHDPVATPVEVPLHVEEELRRSHQFTPSFYNFSFNLFDVAAEERQIAEFNQSRWALIPEHGWGQYVERPENLGTIMGVQLPYRTRRPVHVVGMIFDQNLQQNWQIAGRVGGFIVYRRL